MKLISMPLDDSAALNVSVPQNNPQRPPTFPRQLTVIASISLKEIFSQVK